MRSNRLNIFFAFLFIFFYFWVCFSFIVFTNKSHLNYCPKDLGLQFSCVGICYPPYTISFVPDHQYTCTER